MLWILVPSVGKAQQYASNMHACLSRTAPCFWDFRAFLGANVGVQVLGDLGAKIASNNAPNGGGGVGATLLAR